MKNRSQEEINAILQTFPDVFEDLTGNQLTSAAVQEVIVELLKSKEKELIRQRFFDFSPLNLRDILKKLNEPQDNDDIQAQAQKIAAKVKKGKK